MTHTLEITQEAPMVHLKAYGGVQIMGTDELEVRCDIDAPQLATLVEEDGHVYVTVNSSCSLTVPFMSSIKIEKGMGSIKITNIQNGIEIEKALGNLVLLDIGKATIGKVGGNFAVSKAAGSVIVEKVGGNLIVDDVEFFSGEKIGGNCLVKDIHGHFSLEKAGGSLRAQDIKGSFVVERVGGSFLVRGATLVEDIRAGGDIRLKDFQVNPQNISLQAGGDNHLEIGEDFKGSKFELESGARTICIKVNNDDLNIGDNQYSYAVGDTDKTIEASAGGSISLKMLADEQEDLVGDLSKYFSYEESTFSEMIQERIESATRLAEAKMKAAEIRLEKIQERVGKHRGFNIDVGLDEKGQSPLPPLPPVPPVMRHVGRKGASDEERLMILKMLQEKKITVEEAETLFKALED